MKLGSVSIVNIAAIANDDDDHDYGGENKTASSSTQKRLLFAGDSLFAMLVIGPLVVVHWRGTWAVMDHSPLHFSPAKSLTISMLLLCTIAMLREFLFDVCSCRRKTGDKPVVAGSSARLALLVLKKLYTLIFSFACNMHWRAVFAFLDMLFGEFLNAYS